MNKTIIALLSALLIGLMTMSSIPLSSACTNVGGTHGLYLEDETVWISGALASAKINTMVEFDGETTGNSAEQWACVAVEIYNIAASPDELMVMEMAIMKEHDGRVGIFCIAQKNSNGNSPQVFHEIQYQSWTYVHLAIMYYNEYWYFYADYDPYTTGYELIWTYYYPAETEGCKGTDLYIGNEGRGHPIYPDYIVPYAQTANVQWVYTEGGPVYDMSAMKGGMFANDCTWNVFMQWGFVGDNYLDSFVDYWECEEWFYMN